MALDQSALLEVLDALKGADVEDRIRQAATTIYQALIEAELTSVIGAAPHERTDARSGLRNGHRPKTITTTAGDLQLQIPKLRAGSFFPSLLERRRRTGDGRTRSGQVTGIFSRARAFMASTRSDGWVSPISSSMRMALPRAKNVGAHWPTKMPQRSARAMPFDSRLRDVHQDAIDRPMDARPAV
jgi:hypothetical protein